MKRRSISVILFKSLAVLLISIMLVMCLPINSVIATGSVALSLNVDNYGVNAGEDVIVTLTASPFEDITEFGPIEFYYDTTKMILQNVIVGDEFSDKYTITSEIDETNGRISISGEYIGLEGQGNAEITGEEGVTESLVIDADYDSIDICSIQFTALENSSGSARFWIGSALGFRNSLAETINTTYGDGVTVTISPTVSSDATLSMIRISGTTLEPEFNPYTYYYDAYVSKDVTEVLVYVTTSNLSASYTVSGGSNLRLGDNVITINVVSQDGASSETYTIILNRRDGYVPTGAFLTNSAGVDMSFIEITDSSIIPAGYTQVTRTINGYSVPVFARDGIESVLCYLQGEDGNGTFFFYNPTSRRTTPFFPNSTVVQESVILNPMKLPPLVTVPEGFEPDTRSLENSIINGYSNSRGDFISYFVDEDGSGSFYIYDKTSGSFTIYIPTDRFAQNAITVLFLVFFAVSILEALMIIAIVFSVRKSRRERVNPKPKRV